MVSEKKGPRLKYLNENFLDEAMTLNRCPG